LKQHSNIASKQETVKESLSTALSKTTAKKEH